MRTTLLSVIKADIVKKSQKVGLRVRWVQDTAYDVDEEELKEYAQQLRADLEKAGAEDLVLDYDDTTERESSEEETEPTRINSDEETLAETTSVTCVGGVGWRARTSMRMNINGEEDEEDIKRNEEDGDEEASEGNEEEEEDEE
ncbi:hypothetical protein EV426DRAFT_639895 [Tirmania nivea]|nr:hypothetical protein EV426DRAFT_639895 [Tirmania nivea]